MLHQVWCNPKIGGIQWPSLSSKVIKDEASIPLQKKMWLLRIFLHALSLFWKFESLLIVLPACDAFSEPSPRAPGRFWPPPCRATAPGHGEPVQPHRWKKPRTEESARLRDRKDPTATTLHRLPWIHNPQKWWNLIAWWFLFFQCLNFKWSPMKAGKACLHWKLKWSTSHNVMYDYSMKTPWKNLRCKEEKKICPWVWRASPRHHKSSSCSSEVLLP